MVAPLNGVLIIFKNVGKSTKKHLKGVFFIKIKKFFEENDPENDENNINKKGGKIK